MYVFFFTVSYLYLFSALLSFPPQNQITNCFKIYWDGYMKRAREKTNKKHSYSITFKILNRIELIFNIVCLFVRLFILCMFFFRSRIDLKFELLKYLLQFCGLCNFRADNISGVDNDDNGGGLITLLRFNTPSTTHQHYSFFLFFL